MRVSLIIVAGGSSTRMGGDVRKPYLCIKNKPIFYHTLKTYSNVSDINQIIFVVNEMDIQQVKDIWGESLKEFGVTDIITGGKRRQDSVGNGLKRVNTDSDIVLIHDCVRPFISKDIVLQVIDQVITHGAAIVAVPVKDTIKEVGKDMAIKRTVPRADLWAAQTPQGFKYEIVMKAFSELEKQDFDVTDDAQMVERCGYNVSIVTGSYDNIKITTPDDLKIAEAFLL